MKMPFNVFLDMDGVLADFDKRAIEICGVRPRDFEGTHGEQALWDKVYSVDNFFLSLDLMPDAYELWHGVKDMGFDPWILTGTPKEKALLDDRTPAEQKKEWGWNKFKTTRVITCPSKEKFKHMKGKGDVLIDDWHKYMHVWNGAGGSFILHKDAKTSLRALKAYLEQVILI